jgi:hypothetical protein
METSRGGINGKKGRGVYQKRRREEGGRIKVEKVTGKIINTLPFEPVGAV